MVTPSAISDEDIGLLDELSGLGMAMSRDFQGRCLAVGDAREAADLALGFQRSSRSVRQCIALKARLLRDRVRFGREDRAHEVRETEGRMLIRKAQVRLSVERCVWNEADGPEAERLLGELDDILEAETFSDDFVQGAAASHIARICEELGVTPPTPALANGLSSPAGEGGARDVVAGKPRVADLSGKLPPPRFERSPCPDGGGEEGVDPDEPLHQSSA
jgi:hypothetical protein